MADGNKSEEGNVPEQDDAVYRDITPEELWEGLPPINLGALFMPPIWGPSQGIWITILWYPLWLFCDNLFYSAYSDPQPLSIALSAIVFVVMAAVTIGFARISQGYACNRALSRGKTKEQYLRSQKKWAIGMGIFALVLIVLATWYNLCVRPTLGV